MRNAENCRVNGTKLSADFNFDYYGEFYMKIDNKKARIILAVIIAVSLVISTVYMFSKQGFHEDELLTYNLANSSKQLNVDGGWNSPEDFNEYLAVSPDDRFDYAQVYENQIIDASHPPLYYALVHTVCSFFPGVFSKWLAYSINVLAMAGILIMLYKIGQKITGNNLYALIGAGAYALSIACITTTIYLRMYATLTFWVLAFVYMSIKLYEKKNTVGIKDCILLVFTVLCGVLTQYYFILFAGLTGLVFLVFKIKEKCGKDLIKYIIAAVVGAGLALCIYPYIISNVLGGNRGLSSLDMSALDMITVVTYVFYKLCTYVQILAKDMFINQVWLLGLCTAAVIGFGIYFRFVKKVKIPKKAMFAVVPAVCYFIGISLVSPFNSDRYVMASLPLIAMLFAFSFIRIFTLFKNQKIRLAVPACILLASVTAFVTVKPYYTYGKTNLYEPKTDNCIFVGTAMLEWNKCIDKFMNSKPVAPQDVDLDKDAQVAHANIAIASSNIVGKGPGNSVERDFLSQAFSDFIYAIIIEEMGIWGAALVAFLYIILLFRAGRIANRCENNFPAFLCMGLAIMLVTQALFNMAVAVGLAPVTGQPLPLISRGGTSTIINCLYLGIILSISRTAKKKEIPQNELDDSKMVAA